MNPPGADASLPRPDPDPLRRRMARGAGGTVVLNVAGSGLNLVIALLLTRALGLSGYGVVVFVIGTLMLLTVPAVFGLDRLLTREIAVNEQRGEHAVVRGLIGSARRFTLLLSLLIGLAAAAITWILAGGRTTVVGATMWLGLVSLPFAVWNRVQQGAILGLRRIVAAQVPEMLVRPAVFIGLVGVAMLAVGSPLAPELAILLHVVSFALAVAVGGALLGRYVQPDGGAEAPPGVLSLARAAPFAVVGGASVVNNHAGIVLLGLMAATDEAGLFGAAARLAMLVPFPLTAVNAALAPTAARLWDSGRADELRRLTTWSARLTLLVSLPAALALVFFGEWFLGVAFPPQFVPAATALAILSLGQLANAGMGPVGTLLMMTGHQRSAATGVIVGACVTVALGLVLIPLAGATGAAIAGATSLVAWNLWLTIETRRLLGIDCTPFGLHPRWSDEP